MIPARRSLGRWGIAAPGLVGLVPALALWLQATAILPLVWERVPIDGIQTSPSGAYAAPLGTGWMSEHATGGSPAQLLENGVRLPLPNSPIEDVGGLGAGRYAVSDGYVYFTAPDNSDPRTNGRRYDLYWPQEPHRWLVRGARLLGMAGLCWVLIVFRRTVWRVLTQPPFWFAAAVFLIITVANRLWFFLDVPVPGLYPDSASYYTLAEQIAAGQWPEFSVRTPGYPLLLAAVFGLSDSLMAVILVQNALMLISGVLLIHAFHALRPWLAIWAALGVSVYSCGLWAFEHDTAVLSDSPYSYAIMFAFASLILGLVRRRAGDLALASTAMAATILLRPAGAFFFVVYACCLAFLWRNRFERIHVTAFAVPLPALMLALCTYNYSTFGAFSMTAFGESQLAFATFTFWEPDPAYPPAVNDAVRRTQDVMRRQVNGEQRTLLVGSWDFRQLAPIFLAGFHYPALAEASTIDGRSDYLAARAWIRRISLDSIAKHRDLYLKFVLTQLWLQYFSNVTYQEDFQSFVRNRLLEMYGTTKYVPGKGDSFYVDMAKEYATRPAPPAVRIEGEGAAAHAVVRQPSVWRRLFLQTLELRRDWFSTVFWVWCFFAALAAASLRLVLTKGRHLGAFIAFILTISLFGASLVIALVEYGGHRYSYVLEYVYYLPVVVLPFMNIGPGDRSRDDGNDRGLSRSVTA